MEKKKKKNHGTTARSFHGKGGKPLVSAHANSDSHRRHPPLFIFQANVGRQDVGILEESGHVRVAGTMVQHQTANQAAFLGGAVLHLQAKQPTSKEAAKRGVIHTAPPLAAMEQGATYMHQLHHVQVNGRLRVADGQHSIGDNVSQHVSILFHSTGK